MDASYIDIEIDTNLLSDDVLLKLDKMTQERKISIEQLIIEIVNDFASKI